MVSRSVLDRSFAEFVRRGDPDALAEVYVRVAPFLVHRARRLLRNERHAEDVVQDLFLSLLQSAGGFDPARPCLPYLIGLLHHKAAHWRRRKALGEMLRWRRPVGAACPIQMAQAQELRAAVTAAAADLPRPYRDVVLRWLIRQETPLEIGRALGRPAGTVRVQLHRALRALRERLPRGLQILLLGLLLPRRAPTATLPIRRRSRWLLGTAAGIAAGGAWIWLAPGLSAPEIAPALQVPVAMSAAAPPGLESSATPETRRDPMPPPRTAALVLDIQRSDGAVAAAVGVSLRPTPREADFAGRAAVSDARGSVRFDGLTPGEWQVTLDRGPGFLVWLAAGEQTAHEVTLLPGARVRGEVRDAAGRPLPGAGIWIAHEPRQPWTGQVVAHADREGRFELWDLPALAMLGAVAPGHAPSPLTSVGPRPERTMELVLGESPARVRGLVHDSNGQPVADALVQVGYHPRARYVLPGGEQFAVLHPSSVVRTDAAGAFTAVDLPAGEVQLSVRAPGFVAGGAAVRLMPGGELPVAIRLRAGLVVGGVVRDPDGAPVAGASVLAHGRARHEWCGLYTGSDGRFLLEGVGAERAVLEVEADGYLRREILAPPGSELEVVLEPAPVCAGRLVRDDAGSPGDLELAVLPCGDPGPPLPLALAADGSFRVTGVDTSARFLARVRGDIVWLPCEQKEGRGRVVVRAPPPPASARIRVRVQGCAAETLQDAVLVLRDRLGAYLVEPGVDQDGSLWSGPIPCGTYRLEVQGRQGRVPALDLGEVVLDQAGAEVTANAVGHGTLRFALRRADGFRVEQMRGFLVGARGHVIPLRAPEGSLALMPGRYELSAASLSFPTVRAHVVDVAAAATTELVLELAPARPRQVGFRLPPAQAERCVVRMLQDDRVVMAPDEDAERSGFDATADGWCSVVAVLAEGRYTLEVVGEETWSGEFTIAGRDGEYEPIEVALRKVMAGR